MADKKKKPGETTVSIPKEQHDRIKEIAERDGKKVKRVVQEIVEKGLQATN